MKNIKQLIRRALQQGVLHVILSSSLVKIIGFMSAIFLPRFLSKADYGLLADVDNLRSYFLFLSGLGMTNATLRFCAEDVSNEEISGYFSFSMVTGGVFNLFLVAFSIVTYLLTPFAFEGTRKFLVYFSALPIFLFTFENMQFLLRSRSLNRSFSVLSIIFSISMVVTQIGASIWYGLDGLVVARYSSYIFGIFLGFVIIRRNQVIKRNMQYPDKKTRKKMIRFGISVMFASMSTQLMQHNELTILSFVLRDQEILADYKLSSYIFTLFILVVTSIAMFFYPYFVRHKNDKRWLWSNFKKLSICIAVVMAPVHIVLYFLLPSIIPAFFGEKYLTAIPFMQLMVLASFIVNSLRVLVNNLLPAIDEEKFQLKVNVIAMLCHGVLDFLIVSHFGIYGSIACLIAVYIITSGIMLVRFYRHCHPKKA